MTELFSELTRHGSMELQVIVGPDTSDAYVSLRRFLDEAMSMSHIYQPVMIRTLLAQGGSASRREIAIAFLNADLGQIEYYEQIVRRYPHATLKSHGIISAGRATYCLNDPVSSMSDAERSALIDLCDTKVAEYIDRRRNKIWAHRTGQLDPVSGSLRYRIIARARGRCEACGAGATETTLHVDHIIPRSLGGSNDPFNLQALCSTCNIEKLNHDDTDFRSAQAAYSHREAGCSTCEADDAELPSNTLAKVVLRSANQIVLAPKRHARNYLDLGQAELNALRMLETSEADRIGKARVAGLRIPDPMGEHCLVHIDLSSVQR
ncbi:HNH endonuclease [Brevundimonas goettingensis]|uniref:HNH endonuclease n=1 Tax=Brevundimonas goettingensis TaxID=2774190 RepID=A0A975GUL8_9CAUL|nr:HNH endonuclease signature motif containing protein [Brevundimonas goettingensis]QTC90326.1 HNH endonuclease [Brevundimonas goettingensis]